MNGRISYRILMVSEWCRCSAGGQRIQSRALHAHWFVHDVWRALVRGAGSSTSMVADVLAPNRRQRSATITLIRPFLLCPMAIHVSYYQRHVVGTIKQIIWGEVGQPLVFVWRVVARVITTITQWWEKKTNNALVTVNNDFWVTSDAICHWFSRVTKSQVKIIGKSHHEWPKIVIRGNECIISFLTRYFMSWTHNSTKNNHRSLISQLSLRDGIFLTQHCDVTTVDLWRHANVWYWHCDVIVVDCSCTCQLAQRQSSLVNYNREYRFLTTRYSRLSV